MSRVANAGATAARGGDGAEPAHRAREGVGKRFAARK